MAFEMIESSHYNKEFYNSHEAGSFQSALEIIPIISDIFKPSSVIDIGCGSGVWLQVWMNQQQLTDVSGIEGPYVKAEQLRVPVEVVRFEDLKLDVSFGRKYDLVTTLEVAEHLPENRAESFVRMITNLSDVVVFSAAIPGQEGTYHINEQYPEYWAKQFIKQNYIPFDLIRDVIWNNNKIEWWYRQNILIFINASSETKLAIAQNIKPPANPELLTRIHPLLFEYKLRKLEKTKSFFSYLRWKLYPLKKFILRK